MASTDTMTPEQKRTTFETWELQVAGAVWVFRKDGRSGEYRQMKLSGRTGPKRVTLTVDDREYYQSRLRDDRQHYDVFTNGSLVQIDDKGNKVGELTDELLGKVLDLEGEAFEEAVVEIDLELTMRRLYELAQREATVPKVEFIRSIIDERYRVGGTQRSVREMFEDGEVDRLTIS